jgi:hypothetical protein
VQVRTIPGSDAALPVVRAGLDHWQEARPHDPSRPLAGALALPLEAAANSAGAAQSPGNARRIFRKVLYALCLAPKTRNKNRLRARRYDTLQTTSGASFNILIVWFALLLAWVAPAHGEEPAEEPADDAPTIEYPRPERVQVGVHVNDIQGINLKDHTYAVDAYFWFRWKNPEIDPAASMEFVNPSELWGHTVTPVYEEPESLPDGSLYQVVRIQGRFSRKMPLFNYPFDRQQLTMVFEDTTHELANLVYEPDGPGVTLNSALVLPGYEIGAPELRIEAWNYPTNFGDTRVTTASRYTRGTIAVPVVRPAVPYAIKLLVPVAAVIMCATLMFLLAPNFVDSRVDVGITSLLTIVALQMTFNQDLPDVGYLMLMDKVYLASYGFVIAGLGVVVRTTRTIGTAEEAGAMTLHRRSLALLTGAYLTIIATMVTSALREG